MTTTKQLPMPGLDAPAEERRPTGEPLIAAGPQLDPELAHRAYNWTSFTPEVRAEQEVEAHKRHLIGTYQALVLSAETPEQIDLLAREFADYQAGSVTRKHAQLEAQSRTASPMITGPARFPTARNQKRLDTESKRRAELLEWDEKAVVAIKRKLLDARTPDQVAADDWRRLKREIDRDIAVIIEIDTGQDRFAGMTRSAFTTSITDKIRRRADNGQTGLATRALAYIRERQAGLTKPIITERNSIWNVTQKAEARQEEQPPRQGEETIAEQDGVRAVRNYDLARLQIFFVKIPSALVREQLKAGGWHWSPTSKAWQRKITLNAEHALREFLQGYRREREDNERRR